MKKSKIIARNMKLPALALIFCCWPKGLLLQRKKGFEEREREEGVEGREDFLSNQSDTCHESPSLVEIFELNFSKYGIFLLLEFPEVVELL